MPQATCAITDTDAKVALKVRAVHGGLDDRIVVWEFNASRKVFFNLRDLT